MNIGIRYIRRNHPTHTHTHAHTTTTHTHNNNAHTHTKHAHKTIKQNKIQHIFVGKD